MRRQLPTSTAAPPRRCYVHIGTPKTGSTSLQAFLGQNRAQFAQSGVFLPHSAGGGNAQHACHHAVVSDLLSEPRRATGGLDTVYAELAASTAPHSCISSENFSLLYDRPELLTRLRDAIVTAGFEPVIVAFLRPQVSYASAIYALNVLDGYRTSFATFVDTLVERGAYVWRAGYGPQFDYVRLLDGFAAVFGPSSIVARRFATDAPDAALLRSFVDVVLPQTPFERFDVPPQRANRTLTFGSLLRLLGSANEFDEHVRFAPFELRDIGRCWLRFAPSNRRLVATYGVRVPVFDPVDLLRALPVRRTPGCTRELGAARRALRALQDG